MGLVLIRRGEEGVVSKPNVNSGNWEGRGGSCVWAC